MQNPRDKVIITLGLSGVDSAGKSTFTEMMRQIVEDSPQVFGTKLAMGSVVAVIFQMAGGLRASMHYCGCASVADIRLRAADSAGSGSLR